MGPLDLNIDEPFFSFLFKVIYMTRGSFSHKAARSAWIICKASRGHCLASLNWRESAALALKGAVIMGQFDLNIAALLPMWCRDQHDAVIAGPQHWWAAFLFFPLVVPGSVWVACLTSALLGCFSFCCLCGRRSAISTAAPQRCWALSILVAHVVKRSAGSTALP